MKKLASAALIAVLLVGALGAQGKKDHPAGTMALQFSVYGLGSFGIDGFSTPQPSGTTYAAPVGLGGRYYLNDSLALGGVVGFKVFSTTPSGGTSSSITQFGLKPLVLSVLKDVGPVELSWGGYLSLGYFNNTGTSVSSTAFGLGGILAAEYYFLPKLSLGAEYDLGLGFQSNSTASSSNFGTDSLATTLTLYL